jgi:hypothetical protein
MRFKRTITSFLVLMAAVSFAVRSGTAVTIESPHRATATPADVPMLQPLDLFLNFPGIKWGMSFPDAKKAIEKSGAPAVGARESKTELSWDGSSTT